MQVVCWLALNCNAIVVCIAVACNDWTLMLNGKLQAKRNLLKDDTSVSDNSEAGIPSAKS
jgi:hypothetical protein